MVERLFLAVPQGCLLFVIVVFPDHTHLLFFSIAMVQRSPSHLPFTISKKYINGPLLVKLNLTHRQVRKGKVSLWFLGELDWNSGI